MCAGRGGRRRTAGRRTRDGPRRRPDLAAVPEPGRERARRRGACSASRRRATRSSPSAEPVGTEIHRRGRRPRARRSRDGQRRGSRCRRGPIPRWTATRSGAADTAGGDRGRPRRAPGHRRHRGRRRARGRRSRPGTAARIATGAQAPRRRGRGRPGRGHDAARRGGHGPVRAAATPPGPCPAPASSTSRSSRAARSARRAATSARARPPRAGHARSTAAAVALIAGRGRRRVSSSIVGRGSRSSPRATRSGRPGQALGPAGHPRRQRPGPARPRHGGRRRADRPRDRRRRSRRRPRAGSARPGRGRRRAHRVRRRLGRSVRRRQDRHRDHRPDRPLAGRRPARQAVRVRDVADRPGGGAPVLLFGLPGNPVSSAVTFELFVRPGDPGARRPARPAPTGRSRGPRRGRLARATAGARSCAWRPSATRPVRRSATPAAASRVHLAGGQGSHVISALAAADALAVIPEADDTLPAGAEVALWWLDRA